MPFHLTDPRAWGRVKSRHSFLWPPPHSLPHPGVYTPDGQGSGIDYYDLLYAMARAVPALDLDFKRATLYDQISGNNLITHTRTSTGTYIGADGLIKTAATDESRFAYDPVTHECLGLLVEGAATNLLLRSEEFGATWAPAEVTISSDAVVAPNGAITADKLIPDVDKTSARVRQDPTVADNTVYTFSVYVRAAEFSTLFLQFFDKAGGFAQSRTFNASTGELSGSETGSSVTSVQALPNAWYRLILSGINSSSGATAANARIRLSAVHTGDGTSGIYLWGAQLEAGNGASSYIPTTTATVTRAADVVTLDNTVLNSNSNGTIIFQFRKKVGARFDALSTSPINSTSDVTLISNTGQNIVSATADAADASGFAFVDDELCSWLVAWDATNKSRIAFGSPSTGSGVRPEKTRTVAISHGSATCLGRATTSTNFLSGTIPRVVYWPEYLAEDICLSLVGS